MEVEISIIKRDTAGSLPSESLLWDTPVDDLHPDKPEFSSDTRCHCNMYVTL